MLLPGDARNQLESGRAERHSILRRGSDGKSGAPKSGKQVKKPAQGFGSDGDGMDIAGTLDAWQKSNDDHLFKLIISPEFGERMDLQRHTKELVKQMEKDTGTRLQWVAVGTLQYRTPSCAFSHPRGLRPRPALAAGQGIRQDGD